MTDLYIEEQTDWLHRYALEEIHFQLQKTKKSKKELYCALCDEVPDFFIA
ncbi:MAG: hypothetical protein LBT59_25310 [Clostridiales bacterium]|jgi:hypothetical protein|nr:hypothetical protein [Clostridiales bacterium]